MLLVFKQIFIYFYSFLSIYFYHTNAWVQCLQGTSDEFLTEDLLIDNFVKAANERKDNKVKVDFHLEEDHGHSYFFVSTFIEEHFKFHSSKLSS